MLPGIGSAGGAKEGGGFVDSSTVASGKAGGWPPLVDGTSFSRGPRSDAITSSGLEPTTVVLLSVVISVVSDGDAAAPIVSVFCSHADESITETRKRTNRFTGQEDDYEYDIRSQAGTRVNGVKKKRGIPVKGRFCAWFIRLCSANGSHQDHVGLAMCRRAHHC